MLSQLKTYISAENADIDNEQYQSGVFISRILDDIGTIPCKVSDLAENEECPEIDELSTILCTVGVMGKSQLLFDRGCQAHRPGQAGATRSYV